MLFIVGCRRRHEGKTAGGLLFEERLFNAADIGELRKLCKHFGIVLLMCVSHAEILVRTTPDSSFGLLGDDERCVDPGDLVNTFLPGRDAELIVESPKAIGRALESVAVQP
jgi:hypothetical protein